MSESVVYLLFGSIVLFSLIDAVPMTTGLRLRRERPAVNTSVSTSKISALTEDASVAASWEKCMVVAPVTIQLLGQLLLVSSVKDASLRGFSPDRKFTYVKNPESLRATLLQISHEGYHAFLSAHSTMNTIQLRMVQIPKHIKTAVKLLAGNYPHRVLNRLLPMILGNVEDTGKECVSVTNSTEQEFHQVMKLIDEVVQSTKATESEHIDAVSKNERELEALRAQQESLAKEEKRRAELYKQATDAANRAEESYYQALKEIPTGWEALLQDFVRGVSKVANTVAKVGAQVLAGGMGNPMLTGVTSMMTGAMGKRSIDGVIDGDHEPSFGFSQTVDMASRFSNSLETFRQALGSSGGNITIMDGLSVVFKTFREYISRLPDNSAKSKVLDLMQRSERLVKKASKNGKLGQPNRQVEEEVTDELEDISNQMQPYKTANQLADPMPPNNKGSSSGSADRDQLGRDSSRNEVLKAQIAQAQLTEMRRRQDAYAAELSKILEQARETNSKIISIDLTTIDYREIIKMLEEAFKLLAKLREEWHHFVIFFKAMSQQVKGMVEHSLKRFLQMAGVGNDLEHALRLRLIGDLKEDTYSIHSQSYVLFVLARTYYDVSGKYLMSRLSTLSSMLISRSPEERDRLRLALQTDTENVIQEIKGLIDKRANDFDAELEARNKELSNMIDELGGPNVDAEKVIKDANQLLDADANWSD